MPNHRPTNADAERNHANANLGHKDDKRGKASNTKLAHMQNDEVGERDRHPRSDAKKRRRG